MTDPESRSPSEVENLEALDEAAMSRRMLLTGAAGGGLLLVGLPGSAEARSAAGPYVGAGQTDRQTVGFVAQVMQAGPSLTGYGYLTRIRGLSLAGLYVTPPALTGNDPRSQDPSAARFTLTTEGTIRAMSAVGEVLSSVIAARVSIYHQPAGGARFDDPSSFARGQRIASFAATLQNDLSVDGENQGSLALTGDLTQETAPRFRLSGGRRTFGRKGLPWVMRATGRGHRTEPTAPRAELFISGALGVVDAAPLA